MALTVHMRAEKILISEGQKYAVLRTASGDVIGINSFLLAHDYDLNIMQPGLKV